MLRSAARASALLSDARNEAFVEAASEYGESLGMAFQIVDDILDFQVFPISRFFFFLFYFIDLLDFFLKGWNWKAQECRSECWNRNCSAFVCC